MSLDAELNPVEEETPPSESGKATVRPATTTLPVVRPVRPLEKRRLQCYLIMMVGDICALMLGFAAAGYLYLGQAFDGPAMMSAQLILPLFLSVALYNGAYSLSAISRPVWSQLRACLALAIAAVVVTFIAFYTKSGADFSRVVLSLGVGASMLTLVFWRDMIPGIVKWRCGDVVQNVMVVHDGGPRIEIPGAYYLDAVRQGLAPDLSDPIALDRLSRQLNGMDRVLVSCVPEHRATWAMVLKGLSVEGEVVDDTVFELGAIGARHAHGHGMLMVSRKPLGLRKRAMKRLFDVVVAGGVLTVLSPLMIGIAVAIRLYDGGPAFFVQNRMGRSNTLFRMYKFRSMSVAGTDADGIRSASRTDGRVTPIGRLIRRTSIDELPQLINVLMGQMSIVGPRPHALGSQAGEKLFWEIDDRYWQRHTLKPGLTGLAQVRGLRGATDTEDDLIGRLQADLQYLDGWSLWRDIAIVLATARVLIHHRAY